MGATSDNNGTKTHANGTFLALFGAFQKELKGFWIVSLVWVYCYDDDESKHGPKE